jgi:hypothetical protein
MKTRLIKNWVTTLFGLITFAVATYLLQKGTITLESFIAALPTVALLFRAKDSLLWSKPKE